LHSLHRIIVSLFIILLSSAAAGSNPYYLAAGADGAGMGSVCIMRPGFWSSFRNQALLTSFSSLSAGISYESRFNIGELSTRTAAVIIPAGRSSLGIIYSHFGFPHFRRTTCAMACGLKLSDIISAGIQIDYFLEKTSGEYSNTHSLTFEGGLVIIPAENITVGIQIFNPVPSSLRKTFLPSAIRTGAGIKLNKNLFAGFEAELSSETRLLLRTGFEYEVAAKFMLRGGFCSENSSFTFGSGYHFRSVDLDMGFATHERLGITTSVSMMYKIKNKK